MLGERVWLWTRQLSLVRAIPEEGWQLRTNRCSTPRLWGVSASFGRTTRCISHCVMSSFFECGCLINGDAPFCFVCVLLFLLRVDSLSVLIKHHFILILVAAHASCCAKSSEQRALCVSEGKKKRGPRDGTVVSTVQCDIRWGWWCCWLG